MQALLSVDGAKDLYGFWGDTLARTVARETDTVVDLASKEYSRAVTPHLPKEVTVHRCTFAVLKNGKAVEQGTLCKMARGEMVRWMAQNRVTNVEQLRRLTGWALSMTRTAPPKTMTYFYKEEHKRCWKSV